MDLNILLVVAALLTQRFVPSGRDPSSDTGQVSWHCAVCEPPRPAGRRLTSRP